MKISGSSQLLSSNFLGGTPDPEAPGVRPYPGKWAFLENLSPPTVLDLQRCDTPFWNREVEAYNLLGAEF